MSYTHVNFRLLNLSHSTEMTIMTLIRLISQTKEITMTQGCDTDLDAKLRSTFKSSVACFMAKYDQLAFEG